MDDDDETLRTYTMTGGDGYGDLISEYQESGGGEYYHQFDANANSNAIIDDSCTVAQQYRYQAFGLPIPLGGGGDPSFGGSSLLWGGQKGYYFDADTQLYLLGAGTTGRWYDPATGKYLSEDPTRYGGGDNNLQRYVGNNPVNLVDPNGHGGTPEYLLREQAANPGSCIQCHQPASSLSPSSNVDSLLGGKTFPRLFEENPQLDIPLFASAELRRIEPSDGLVPTEGGFVEVQRYLPGGTISREKKMAWPPSWSRWEYREVELTRDVRSGWVRLARYWCPKDAAGRQMVDAANARVEAKRQTERKRQELLEVHARAPVDLKSLETDPQFHYVENKTKGLGVVPMQGRSVYVEDVEFEGENFKVVWAPVLKVNENGKLSAHVVGVVPGAAGHENDQPAAEQYFKHINDELSDAAIKTGFEVALLTIPEIKALRAARAAKALKNAERAAELEEVAMQARKATAADAEKALFGHNEYVVADTAKAGKVKESLEAFYKAKAPKGASIKWVDNVPGGRNGLINTETGEILLSKDLLIKYPQLADGVLVEELQHFHQLQSRGWIGRALTAEENALLEKEVVQRMQRSGFKIFDPRRP